MRDRNSLSYFLSETKTAVVEFVWGSWQSVAILIVSVCMGLLFLATGAINCLSRSAYLCFVIASASSSSSLIPYPRL
jgi:hypothetical protein